MKLLICFYFIWALNTYFSTISAQEDRYPALILIKNENDYDVVDMDGLKNYQSTKFILLACPFTNEVPNKEAAVGVSETRNCLHVEKLYGNISAVENDKICKKPYSPIAFHDNEMNYVVFGYQICLSDDTLKTSLPITSHDGDEMDMYFYAIMYVELKSLSLFYTSHRISLSTNEYIGDFENCKDYSLGISFIQDEHFDDTYEKENQFSILNNFVKPNLSEEELQEMFLIKQQLSPRDDFDSHAKRLVTCSYLNVAPMWTTIANGSWKTIEKFIQKVARQIPIEVTSGTYGTLRLRKSQHPHEKENVVLFNTPVAEIFWKLVQHWVPRTQTAIRKGILIIVYNYISGNVLHKPFCDDNVCEQLGWKVQNDNFKTGYTYCCQVDDNVLNKLHINDMMMFSNFDLNKEKINIS